GGDGEHALAVRLPGAAQRSAGGGGAAGGCLRLPGAVDRRGADGGAADRGVAGGLSHVVAPRAGRGPTRGAARSGHAGASGRGWAAGVMGQRGHPGVLRTGDRVHLDGVQHTVTAIAGTVVRLTDEHGRTVDTGLVEVFTRGVAD